MSDILARLREVHDNRKMEKVHVPEYELDLYFPPLTLADHEAIRSGVDPKDEHALMVSGLIHQAKDKDGSPAFPDTAEIRAELHRVEFGVLARIMAQSSGGASETAQAELSRIDMPAVKSALSRALKDAPAISAAIADTPPLSWPSSCMTWLRNMRRGSRQKTPEARSGSTDGVPDRAGVGEIPTSNHERVAGLRGPAACRFPGNSGRRRRCLTF